MSSNSALVRCPANSKFLACSEFVGCCRSQTCPCPAQDVGEMVLGDLLSTAGTARKNLTEYATCNASGAKWYTCSETQPTYQGCCQINPCQNNGCGSGSNGAVPVAGKLKALQMLLGTSATNGTVGGSANPAATTVSSSSTHSSTSTATNSLGAIIVSPAPSKQLSSGAIAGIVVGIVAIIALAALGGIFLWRRKPRYQEQNRPETRFSEAGTVQDDFRGHYEDSSKALYPSSPNQASFVGSSQSFDQRQSLMAPHQSQTDSSTLRSSARWSQHPDQTPTMSQVGWLDRSSQQQQQLQDENASFQGIGELPANNESEFQRPRQELQGDSYHTYHAYSREHADQTHFPGPSAP